MKCWLICLRFLFCCGNRPHGFFLSLLSKTQPILVHLKILLSSKSSFFSSQILKNYGVRKPLQNLNPQRLLSPFWPHPPGFFQHHPGFSTKTDHPKPTAKLAPWVSETALATVELRSVVPELTERGDGGSWRKSQLWKGPGYPPGNESISFGSTPRAPACNRHKWRFRLGFPTKNGIILVVTVTGWGGRPNISPTFWHFSADDVPNFPFRWDMDSFPRGEISHPNGCGKRLLPLRTLKDQKSALKNWLVVSTHVKNMLVKMGSSSPNRALICSYCIKGQSPGWLQFN